MSEKEPTRRLNHKTARNTETLNPLSVMGSSERKSLEYYSNIRVHVQESGYKICNKESPAKMAVNFHRPHWSKICTKCRLDERLSMGDVEMGLSLKSLGIGLWPETWRILEIGGCRYLRSDPVEQSVCYTVKEGGR